MVGAGAWAAPAARGRRGGAADALLHFARRLVGESHRQNVAGSHAFFDQMRDARGDDARLARARPRQNQDRPFGGLNGLALRWIECGEDGHGKNANWRSDVQCSANPRQAHWPRILAKDFL